MNSTDIHRLYNLLQAVAIIASRNNSQTQQKYFASISSSDLIDLNLSRPKLIALMQKYGYTLTPSMLSIFNQYDVDKCQIDLSKYIGAGGFKIESFNRSSQNNKSKKTDFIDFNDHICSRLYCRYSLIDLFYCFDENSSISAVLKYIYYMLSPGGLLSAVFTFNQAREDIARQISNHIVKLLSRNHVKFFSIKLLQVKVVGPGGQINYQLCVFCKKRYKSIFVD